MATYSAPRTPQAVFADGGLVVLSDNAATLPAHHAGFFCAAWRCGGRILYSPVNENETLCAKNGDKCISCGRCTQIRAEVGLRFKYLLRRYFYIVSFFIDRTVQGRTGLCEQT